MWQGSRPVASTVQAPSCGTAGAEGLGDGVKRRVDLPLSLRCLPPSEKIPRAVVLQVWAWVRGSSITWELTGNASSQAQPRPLYQTRWGGVQQGGFTAPRDSDTRPV